MRRNGSFREETFQSAREVPPMWARRAAALLSCVFAFAVMPQARGEVEQPPFEELIRRSAWIAVIEVSSVRPLARGPRGYLKVASVRVIAGVKGVKVGETIELECDTGYLCPNVRYTAGEKCLVFADRTGSGRYDTKGILPRQVSFTLRGLGTTWNSSEGLRSK
jgi:hypothetical protein